MNLNSIESGEKLVCKQSSLHFHVVFNCIKCYIGFPDSFYSAVESLVRDCETKKGGWVGGGLEAVIGRTLHVTQTQTAA